MIRSLPLPSPALLGILAALATVFLGVPLGDAASIPRPTEEDLIRLVGERPATGPKRVEWKTSAPPVSNLLIYAVEPRRYDQEHFLKLARYWGVSGQPQRMPSGFQSAPGYWIKEPNATNQWRFKSVFFSELSGGLGFGSGEDDHKWDLENHKPAVQGIPSPEEALQRTLEVLPVLGVSTNDLEHTPDGKLRWSYNTEGTTYYDREYKQRKRYVRRINLMLWQRVRDGASTLSIGGGGMLEASYIHAGQLAEIQFLFRQLRPVGSAKPMTTEAVTKAVEGGRARSVQAPFTGTFTVTNCALVYPQHNINTKQEYVWPFYEVRGYSKGGGEAQPIKVYVPLNW